MNWLVLLVARALDPREREIVLGDLAELETWDPIALREILGLVVRRQLLIWTSWRPWFALIGIVGVSGFYLSRMLTRLNIGIFEQVTAWWRFGVHYNTGVVSFRDDVIHMSCLAAAIFCWTTVNASLLRRLSGRASWLTALLFYVVVLNSSADWFVLSGAVVSRGNPPWWTAVKGLLPLNPGSLCIVILFFAIPAFCGAFRKFSLLAPATVVCTLAAALLGSIRAHDLQAFSNGAIPSPPWWAIIAPYALVSWPVLAQYNLFRLGR